MRKYEELIKIIDEKHPEWKQLSIRDLRDISGYTYDASRLALKSYEDEDTTIKKQSKKTKQSNKNIKRSGQPLSLTTQISEITPEVIEGLLVDALNKYPDVATLKLVVEFYTKIKINQGEKLDILDMDKFLKESETIAYDPSSS